MKFKQKKRSTQPNNKRLDVPFVPNCEYFNVTSISPVAKLKECSEMHRKILILQSRFLLCKYEYNPAQYPKKESRSISLNCSRVITTFGHIILLFIISLILLLQFSCYCLDKRERCFTIKTFPQSFPQEGLNYDN